MFLTTKKATVDKMVAFFYFYHMAHIDGTKSGGRKKGTPNKKTAAIRECLADLADNNRHKVQKWLDQTALDDPKGALQLYLQLCEYVLPKLARTELVGDDKKPISVIDMSKWK